MLAHTGGAEALDAPTWLMAYGAAAVVLVVTAGLRGRIVVAAAQTGSEAAPQDTGLAQIVVATAGAAWGVTVAARTLAGARPPGLDPRASLRVLWLTGGGCAFTAAAVVALLSANLE